MVIYSVHVSLCVTICVKANVYKWWRLWNTFQLLFLSVTKRTCWNHTLKNIHTWRARAHTRCKQIMRFACESSFYRTETEQFLLHYPPRSTFLLPSLYTVFLSNELLSFNLFRVQPYKLGGLINNLLLSGKAEEYFSAKLTISVCFFQQFGAT